MARAAPASFELLNQVAQVLRDNPSIKLVRVEGHTDSRGKKKMNRRLFQQRAESVRSYLIEQGISGERLEARDFGMAKPIADNKTDEGRNAKRRVEFNIVKSP